MTSVKWAVSDVTHFLSNLAEFLVQNYDLSPLSARNVHIILPTQRSARTLIDILKHSNASGTIALPTLTTFYNLAELQYDNSACNKWQSLIEIAKILKLYNPILNLQTCLDYAQSLYPLLEEWYEQKCSDNDLIKLFPDHLAEHLQHHLKLFTTVLKTYPYSKTHACARQKALDYLLTHSSIPLLICVDNLSNEQILQFLQQCNHRPNTHVFLLGFNPAFFHTNDDSCACFHLSSYHPQNGFLNLLKKWEIKPASVPIFPEKTTFDQHTTRHHSLTRIYNNDQFYDQKILQVDEQQAFKDVELVECTDLFEEALSIAIMVRHTLMDPKSHVVLATYDRHLVELVKTHLHRWKINSDDSIGTRFFESSLGTFFKLSFECITQSFTPLSMLSLFKHPFFSCNRSPLTLQKIYQEFERLALSHPLQNYPESLHQWMDAADDIDLKQFLLDFKNHSQYLIALAHDPAPLSFKNIFKHHLNFTLALATPEDGHGHSVLFAQETGQQVLQNFQEMYDAAGQFPPCTFVDYFGAFIQLFNEIQLRRSYGYHPRFQITVPLQAQLIPFTHIILASANADTWPNDTPSDVWFTQDMRQTCRLTTSHQNLSLRIQHVINLLQIPRVYITRSLKTKGLQNLASPWLQRLQTALKAQNLENVLQTSHPWRLWAQTLTRTRRLNILERPKPLPITSMRPRSFSVTDIEQLFHDPYAFYARKILKLRALRPLQNDLETSTFGTFVHRLLEQFYTHPKPSFFILDALSSHVLHPIQRLYPEYYSIFKAQIARIAKWVWHQYQIDHAHIEKTYTEVKGHADFRCASGNFQLTAKADRIDVLKNGTMRIIDYKTGPIPTLTQIATGHRPQLILEALIIRQGCFFEIPQNLPLHSIEYWQLGRSAEGGQKLIIQDQLESYIDSIHHQLIETINLYDQASTSYEPAWQPVHASCSYHHLSRRSEWLTLNL